MPDKADRRRHQRASRHVTLTWQEEASEGQGMTSLTQNIGEGGLVFTSSLRPALHAELSMRLSLEQRDGRLTVCPLVGKVIRAEEDAITVAFVRLKPIQFLLLRDYVWRHSEAGGHGGAATKKRESQADHRDQLDLAAA